jgi:hypothetical protein
MKFLRLKSIRLRELMQARRDFVCKRVCKPEQTADVIAVPSRRIYVFTDVYLCMPLLEKRILMIIREMKD